MTIGGSSASADDDGWDEFDNAVWQIVRDAVIAAHEGDVRAAHLATRRLDTDVPVDGRPGTYLWWLLRHRVAQLLSRRPSPDDLHEIATRHMDAFGVVVRDTSVFEDVLLTVWKLAPPEREVTAGRFIVAAVTALGILRDEPASDLDAVRPDLIAWWEKNLANFRRQGILEDRSNAG